MKKLENLNWKCKWTTHLGCLLGCLDYLGVRASDAWLFGVSGHAFVLNVSPELCPSGPTAWVTDRMLELSRNAGCRLDRISAHKTQPEFPSKQRLAWDRARAALDENVPCFAWDIEMPEYYVVNGYDDAGYYYTGPQADNGKGPAPWASLGNSPIGSLEVTIVRAGDPAPPRKAVKEALAYAVEVAGGRSPWFFPSYKAGISGFDAWTWALQQGTANGFGTAYNAAVWAECRRHAAEFLREARDKTGSELDLFNKAISCYNEVAESLATVSELFPFLNVTDERKEANVRDEARCRGAVKALTAARAAEEAGVEILAKIAERL